MRRRYLVAAVFSLPLANALSLASFQAINTNLIPVACATSYTSQIQACVAKDFNEGCTSDCVSGLRKTEDLVQKACSGLIVNSKSLLGKVQAGGIVEALCAKGIKDSTSTTRTTTRLAQTTRPAVTSETTTTRRSTTVQTSTRAAVSSTTTQNNAVPPTTPAPGNGAGAVASASSSSRASTTTQRASEDTGDRSGGGSPFDIVNTNGGSHLERSSIISALVLSGWALLAFGR